MNRMKGMVGVCVHPGKAYFEFKVRLYNRTPFPQPFLWWVNCGVQANDSLQIVFPPDVENVTFHSRAYMATYPVARQLFAGQDWRSGMDISWFKNVVGCVSYFASPSKYDFFGGYDHNHQAGIIHVADHHISPGKKHFTWGQEEFGKAWLETLDEEDGPYTELMGSAYSDNQPDFSWLQPYETKTFNQYYYPVQQIGAAKNANTRLAVNLENNKVGVCSTEVFHGLKVLVTDGDKTILDRTTDLVPGKPFLAEINPHSKISNQPSTLLRVLDQDGNELIRYRPETPKNEPLPPVAVPPTPAEKINSLEELFLTGLHVEQYLHFSLDPAPYWERALQLDPGDARSNNALGRLSLKRGDFLRAESLLRRAIQTLTKYNFNPYDGEPYYTLGMTLACQGRYDDAYDTFYKGIWSYAWQAAGYYAIAQIDCRRGNFTRAIDHLDRSLATNANNNKACNLKAAALRHLGQVEDAIKIVRASLDVDPLDHWAHNEPLRVKPANWSASCATHTRIISTWLSITATLVCTRKPAVS
jgi:tetratricopeptide (TPR) repeat protein